MKKKLQIIFITIVLALSANVIFGQNTTPTPYPTAEDDSDGDGIKNKDDVCPFDKGIIANRGCPSKNGEKTEQDLSINSTAAAIKTNPNSGLKESDKQALADCQYVYQNEGCAKYLGMSKSEIVSIFGVADFGGDYYRLGIHFWYFDDDYLGKISFQFFENHKNYSAFAGKPAQNLEWKATTQETIAKLGEPTSKSNVGGYLDLNYGKYQFAFQENRLTSVSIIDVQGKEIGRSSLRKKDSVVASTLPPEEVKKTTSDLPKTDVSFESKPTATKPNGTLADCKFVLSEGCRNFLLYSNIADVAPALRLIKQSAEKYSNSGLTLYVEPTNGGIIKVRVFSDSGWQPSNNLKFGDKTSKAKEKYPNGTYGSGRYNEEYLNFDDYSFEFEKGKLRVVEIERDRTELERTAKQTREAEIRRQEAEAEANKTPEQRAKEILAIYESFHERIEAEVKRHNKLAEETKDPVVQAIPSMYFSRKEEMSKIRIKTPKMIHDFLTKYAGQLSQAMIDHLNEDLRKLTWQPNR